MIIMTEKTYTSEEMRDIMHKRFIKDADDIIEQVSKTKNYSRDSHAMSMTYV